MRIHATRKRSRKLPSRTATAVLNTFATGTAPHSAAIRHILRGPRVQAKLTVSRPNDKYEQEADRIAEQIMRMAEPQVQRQPEEKDERKEEEEFVQAKPVAEQITPLVQRQIEEEEEELRAKELPGLIPAVPRNLESRINAMKGGGQPLPQRTRAYFEQRFGYDFSQVRVHNNVRAVEKARTLNARAFTVG